MCCVMSSKPYIACSVFHARSCCLAALIAGCVNNAPTQEKDTSREKTALPPTMVSYPNGAALVVDPSQCRVARVQEASVWTRHLEGCEGLLAAAIAPDSIAAIRLPKAIVSFSPEGTEAWRVTTPTAPTSLFAPTVTRDSLVVVAHDKQLVVAYRKGQEAWRVALSASESLTAPPVGNQTEGVLLLTLSGVRAIGADGSLRWTNRPSGEHP